MRDLRDHRGGADHRRDRPPGVRHPAHQLDLRVDQPHRRRLPGRPAEADPRAAGVRARGRGHPAARPAGRGGGRVADAPRCWSARRPSSAVIREGKTHQIYCLMQAGQKFGMQTMNQALLTAVVDKKIAPDHGAGAQLRPRRARGDAGQGELEGRDLGGGRETMPTFVWKGRTPGRGGAVRRGEASGARRRPWSSCARSASWSRACGRSAGPGHAPVRRAAWGPRTWPSSPASSRP